jgi:predicted methyltransferase MtxX (methanogen marker protein 4)
MATIGQTLTNESRVIVNLLLSSQEDAARRRIVAGREILKPLEDALSQAEMRLEQLANSLGFAA